MRHLCMMASGWQQRSPHGSDDDAADERAPLQSRAVFEQEKLPTVVLPPQLQTQPAAGEARPTSGLCKLMVVALAVLLLVWAAFPHGTAAVWSKAVHATVLHGTATNSTQPPGSADASAPGAAPSGLPAAPESSGSKTASDRMAGAHAVPPAAGPGHAAVSAAPAAAETPDSTAVPAPQPRSPKPAAASSPAVSPAAAPGPAAGTPAPTAKKTVQQRAEDSLFKSVTGVGASNNAPAPAPASGPAPQPAAAASPAARGTQQQSFTSSLAAPPAAAAAPQPAPQPDSVNRSGSRSGSSSSSGSTAAHDALCPVRYPRMTEAQLRAGERSYLFGTQPLGCEACRRGFNEESLKAEDHHICEFWSQNWQPEPWGRPVCALWLQKQLAAEWLGRGWTAPLTATPCDLWRFLGPASGFPGRTLWIIGDSQSAALYEALKCFLHAFVTEPASEDSEERTPFNLTALDADIAANATASSAACKVLGAAGVPKGGRVCYLRGDSWAQITDRVLPVLQAAGSSKRDIMVVNTGLHYSPTYAADLKQLVAWHAAHAEQLPYLVWKDTPAQHFDQTHGEWPSGSKPPFKCAPIAGGNVNVTVAHQLVGRYDGANAGLQDAIISIPEGGWRNEAANKVMKEAGVAVSATYNETVPLWQYHRDNGAGYECTHFCSPSAPQVWVFGLIQTLRAHAVHLNAHFGVEELVDLPPSVWPQ